MTTEYHNGRYIPVEIFVDELPNHTTEVSYPLPSVLPSDTSEILLYLFVTAKTTKVPYRGYYEIYTKDENGTRYSQYMNVAFAHDDFTLNSANIWLPVFKERKFYVSIPDVYPLPVAVKQGPKASFKTIKDTVTALKNPDRMVSASFVTGYRTLNMKR